jgi:SAM-dependent methyltransferase
MQSDIERWERKYAERGPHAGAEPDPWLVDIAPRLTRGLALDVACGAGANAAFLAGCGFDVIGLDGSLEGLRLARVEARRHGVRVHFAAVDLEHWRPSPERFALVTVFRYLNRALLPALVASLAPGGTFVCKTFNRGRLRRVPGFNPDYLLDPGELAGLVRGLEIVQLDDDERVADASRVLARKPRGTRDG